MNNMVFKKLTIGNSTYGGKGNDNQNEESRKKDKWVTSQTAIVLITMEN